MKSSMLNLLLVGAVLILLYAHSVEAFVIQGDRSEPIPFYKQGWFIVVCLLLVIIVCIGYYIYMNYSRRSIAVFPLVSFV
jgi:hypothetical protein